MAAQEQNYLGRSDRKKSKKDGPQILVPHRSEPVEDRPGVYVVHTKPVEPNGAKARVRRAIEEAPSSPRTKRRLIDILEQITRP